MEEEVEMVKVRKKINQLVAYTKSLKEEMRQSSVSLEVNGKMYFIE
ncbi:hypothetical protein ACFOU2_19065 [Bacillus songklensis]|uniref:Uncharacterized protein n=1 Tax=Bacillus songklensis TaxID=1069116 RepID=A0ABV8B7W6_9BACI